MTEQEQCLKTSTGGHCDPSLVLVSLSTGPLGRCQAGPPLPETLNGLLEEREKFPSLSRTVALSPVTGVSLPAEGVSDALDHWRSQPSEKMVRSLQVSSALWGCPCVVLSPHVTHMFTCIHTTHTTHTPPTAPISPVGLMADAHGPPCP